ncbi:AraC family transcriptional regulator [Cohnella cellulosilytica]|uniref:AraC family transcriptional regulator n=1 Tax=Cohnella cellulosilytica TaxID=986710 RepID=A0ABW2FKU9_9BACL
MAVPAGAISIRKQMFLSYMLLFTIPLLVFCTVLYSIMDDRIRTDADRTYNSLLSNVANDIDGKLEELNQFNRQLASTDWVARIAHMQGTTIDYTRVDPIMLREYSQQFINYKAINRIIGDIALYFEGKDLVVSSLGETNIAYFKRHMLHTDDLDLDTMVRGHPNETFVPARLYTYGIERPGYLYVQTVPIYGLRSPVLLICFISKQSIQEALNPLLMREHSSVLVADSQGVPLMNEYTENNEPSREKQPSYRYEYVSTQNGWQYTAIVPHRSVSAAITQLRLLVLGLAVLSGFIGWAVSLRLTDRGYKPLNRLIGLIQNRLSSAPGSKPKMNEYDWLQSSLHDLFAQEEAVAEKLRQQQPIVRDAYLKRMLEEGFAANPEFEKALTMLSLAFPCPLFSVCIVDGSPLIPSERRRVVQAGRHAGITVYEVDHDGNTVLLCNYFSAEAFVAYLALLTPEVYGNRAGKRVFFAGGCGDSWTSLARSYTQAKETMGMRFVQREQHVLLYELLGAETASYYYPRETEERLSNLIRAGDRARAADLLNEIFSRNMDRDAIPPAAFRNLLLHMEWTVHRMAQEAGLADSVPIMLQTVTNFRTLSESQSYIRELCEQISDYYEALLLRKGCEQRDRILAFIEDSLTDPSLSLTRVADRFQVSASYLSRYFKEHIGSNFLDYVSYRRYELAKALLADDKQDIKSICRIVGYDSEVTFRRLFKKYAGIAPSLYRDRIVDTGRPSAPIENFVPPKIKN